jgi:predicted nuclease of predicted toxin-antitoxin system
MRVVIDEDIPAALTPRFRAGGHTVNHVEDIGLKGKHNGVLLAAISGSADILVTGDANLGHQQNLKKFDVAIILLHPPRLVVGQIIPLIPEVVAAFATAKRHAVTTIGRPTMPRSGPKLPALSPRKPATPKKATPKKPTP